VSRKHYPWTLSDGFTYLELVAIFAVLAVLCAFAIPAFTGFTLAQRTQGSAQELVAMLNQARRLAITRNTPYSVEIAVAPQSQFRYCSGSVTPCPVANIWNGATAGPNGWMSLANQDQITLGPQITFNTLGAATSAGTLRVKDAQGSTCLDVIVGASGRIRIAATPRAQGAPCP
jgi:Tfp pilus assembly protein FimT